MQRVTRAVVVSLLTLSGLGACIDAATAPKKGQLSGEESCASACPYFSKVYPDTVRLEVGSLKGSAVDTVRNAASVTASSRYGMIGIGLLTRKDTSGKILAIILPFPATKSAPAYDEVVLSAFDERGTLLAYMTIPTTIAPQGASANVIGDSRESIILDAMQSGATYTYIPPRQ